MANSIWVEKTLKLVPTYKKKVEMQYNALVKRIPMNETGLKHINGWVDKTTKGLIKEILKELTPDTILVIVNAIYFKGTWKHVFKAENTVPFDFTLSAEPDDIVEVQMMKQTLRTQYAETKLNQLVVLPFNENNIKFVACLPKDHLNFDPLSTFKATNLQKALKGGSKKVCLSMPKFKLERSFDVKSLLEALGLTKIFDGSSLGDFKGIVEGGNAVVSEVIQKSIIELDEKGAKAAAVTAMVLKRGGAGPFHEEIVNLTLNRPFAFFLVDATSNLILFAGVYRGPN